MKVQLVTFAGCPHAAATREALRNALTATGIEAAIEEIDNSSLEPGDPLQEWGSPTILINGVDVGGEQVPTGRNCRLYRDATGGVGGVPSDAILFDALRLARPATS